MNALKLDITKSGVTITPDMEKAALEANALLYSGKGAGNDFLGWVHLPSSISAADIEAIEAEAARLRAKADVVICIGIGGSYLGAKAVLEAMSDPFRLLHKAPQGPTLLFAGQNISEDYIHEMLEAVKEHSIAAIVISKSGTTTEPAIAFRIIKAEIERRYGKREAAERIVAVTDKARGALKTLATQEGYPTFIIPDDVGGRYSVLTPVGLLPLAVAGIDIMEMMNGAADAKESYDLRSFENPVWQYAAVRNLLYRNGKAMEIFESYEPGFKMFGGWWQQLFGESEGKDGKGLFPVTAEFTADLHSLGQMIQQGQRNIFETMVRFDPPAARYTIGSDWKNLDGLNYLEGKTLDFVDEKAYLGTVAAHVDGGVPVITMDCGELNDRKVGELFYFLELCCGVSAYILDVNPFNQPGVELYKRNMFQLLGKPGYEK